MVSIVDMSFAFCGFLHICMCQDDGMGHRCSALHKACPYQRQSSRRPVQGEIRPFREDGGASPFFTFLTLLVAIDGTAFVVQAKKVEAVIDERFDNAQAWSSLNATAHRQWWAEMKVPDEKSAIALD